MATGDSPQYQLPRKLDKILAATANYYSTKGNVLAHRIVVNSSYRIEERYDYDNWDGGQTGHAIYLDIPSSLYFSAFNELERLGADIASVMNKVARIPHEHIAHVSLELREDTISPHWRQESGVLVDQTLQHKAVDSKLIERLWGAGHVRLFISHKTTAKIEAGEYKKVLLPYGVSSFVAHEDIEPTLEWQEEIERALFTMDVLVAMLTPDFHDSCWTDQEVGIAMGRRVPVIPIRLGQVPYGFIGKYQALGGTLSESKTTAERVYEILWKTSSIHSRLCEALIIAFENAASFSQANTIMKRLMTIEQLPHDLIDRAEKAPSVNNQVADAYIVIAELSKMIHKWRTRASSA